MRATLAVFSLVRHSRLSFFRSSFRRLNSSAIALSEGTNLAFFFRKTMISIIFTENLFLKAEVRSPAKLKILSGPAAEAGQPNDGNATFFRA